MKRCEILPWDSRFFGYGVARITVPRIDALSLEKILKRLAAKNITLVYWPSDPGDDKSQEAARKLGGLLVDEKTTFFADLTELDLSRFQRHPGIYTYTDQDPTPEMDELAIECGKYSRFHTDKNISEEKFKELYKLWLRRSLARITASQFWVCPNESGEIIGMISMKIIGDIVDGDLGAVKKSERGKGIGVGLFLATMDWTLKSGYRNMQLITQGRNKVSTTLYKKFGFKISKIENFYHFWLRKPEAGRQQTSKFKKPDDKNTFQ